MSDTNPIAFKNQIIAVLGERAEKAERALATINEIRNSIIGLQTINWSEHIYPLVAALEGADVKGLHCDEARKNYGTMLERTNEAETRAERFEEALRAAKRACGCDRVKPPVPTPCEPCGIIAAALQPPTNAVRPLSRGLAATVFSAYVLDRAVQYDNGSGARAALETVAESIRKGEALVAFEHGELDDLIAAAGGGR